MVLTNRQRRELHSGIYEYLLAQGPAFEDAANSFAIADPSCINSSNGGAVDDIPDDASVASKMSIRSNFSTYSTGNLSVSTNASATLKRMSNLPVLERKWTSVSRLQRKILELEKIIRANRGIRLGNGAPAAGRGVVIGATDAQNANFERRMLPRPPCSHELKGHSGVVTCVAIHPTSTVAISGSEDGMVKVWDHESGDYLRTFKGHTNAVHSVEFTPTGSHFVSTSSDLTIKLWDFTTNACIRTLRGHEHTVSSAKFLPSPPSLIVPSTNGTVASIHDSSLSLGRNNSTGIDTTVTGSSLLVSASRDKSVKFWDLETGYCQHTITDHNDWVRCVAVRASDGSVMATAGNDTTIFVYSIEQSSGSSEEFRSQQCVKVASLTGHDHVIESIAFVTGPPSSSSKSTSNTNGTTSPTSSVTSTLSNSKTSREKHADKIKDYLASGSRDKTVKLWNIKTQTCIASFAHHKNWVRSVVLHPSGKYILSSSDDRTIRVMEIHSQRCLRTITDAHTHFVTSISMHHSFPILVSGGVDQTLRCWQLDN